MLLVFPSQRGSGAKALRGAGGFTPTDSPTNSPDEPLFVRVGLPKSAQEARFGGAPEAGGQLPQKPLAIRTFIVQNGPAWS